MLNFQIDNERLNPNSLETDCAIAAYGYAEKSRKWERSAEAWTWTHKANEKVDEKTVFSALVKKISEGIYHKLIDFENHVDDVSKSYENKELV
jgi:hypothetical protein